MICFFLLTILCIFDIFLSDHRGGMTLVSLPSQSTPAVVLISRERIARNPFSNFSVPHAVADLVRGQACSGGDGTLHAGVAGQGRITARRQGQPGWLGRPASLF